VHSWTRDQVRRRHQRIGGGRGELIGAEADHVIADRVAAAGEEGRQHGRLRVEGDGRQPDIGALREVVEVPLDDAALRDVFLRKDREFLFGLYRQAGAPMLLGMIEALWLRRGPLFWEARWALMARPPEAAHRHEAILAALRRGDGEGAAILWSPKFSVMRSVTFGSFTIRW
jgi:hypothetical protein